MNHCFTMPSGFKILSSRAAHRIIFVLFCFELWLPQIHEDRSVWIAKSYITVDSFCAFQQYI
jgi:hypothetical protein